MKKILETAKTLQSQIAEDRHNLHRRHRQRQSLHPAPRGHGRSSYAGSARVCGFTDLGCLSPGYRASFIRLDRDIFSIPAAEIDQVSVAAAYVNGRKVYVAEGPAAE